MIQHLDDEGRPCTRHVVNEDKLFAYAAVGTRISGFHHDAASKLQSLIMALDEISELIGENHSDVRTATETAQAAVRQLHGLLSANRALARGPQVTRTLLPDLVQRAADRHAVRLRGELPAFDLMVSPPSMTHAVAMLLDLIAGAPSQGRMVEVSVTKTGERVQLTLGGNTEPTHPNTSELIAVAAYMIARENGTVRCGPQRFVVDLAGA